MLNAIVIMAIRRIPETYLHEPNDDDDDDDDLCGRWWLSHETDDNITLHRKSKHKRGEIREFYPNIRLSPIFIST